MPTKKKRERQERERVREKRSEYRARAWSQTVLIYYSAAYMLLEHWPGTGRVQNRIGNRRCKRVANKCWEKSEQKDLVHWMQCFKGILDCFNLLSYYNASTSCVCLYRVRAKEAIHERLARIDWVKTGARSSGVEPATCYSAG